MKKLFVALLMAIAILHSISGFGGTPLAQCSLLLADISNTSSSSTEVLKRVLRQLVLTKNALSADQVDTLLKMKSVPNPGHFNFQNLSSEEKFAYTNVLRVLLEGPNRGTLDWPDVRKDLNEVLQEKGEQERTRSVTADETKKIFYPRILKIFPDLGQFVFSDSKGTPYFGGTEPKTIFSPVGGETYPIPAFGQDRQYYFAPNGTILFHYDGRKHQAIGGEKILHIFNIKTSEDKSFDLEPMGLVDHVNPGQNVAYFTGQDGKLKAVVRMTLVKEAAHMAVLDIESGRFEKIEYLSENTEENFKYQSVFVTHAGRIFVYEYDKAKIAVREIPNPFLKKSTTPLESHDLNIASGLNGFAGHHFMYEDASGQLYLYSAYKGSLIVRNLSRNREHTFNDVNIESRVGLEGPYENSSGDIYLLSRAVPALVGSSQVGMTVFNLKQFIAKNIGSSNPSDRATEVKLLFLSGGRTYAVISSKGENSEISSLYFEDLTGEHNQLLSLKGLGLKSLYYVDVNSRGDIVGYFLTSEGLAVVQLYGPLNNDKIHQ